MALDILDNVKTDLLVTGSTDDALLTRLMDAAESFIAQFTGRAFAGGTFTETHGGGRAFLFLRNFPVASITSFRADTARQFGSSSGVDANSYVVHAERGVIESLIGPFLIPRPGRGPDDWPEALQV